MVHYTIKLNKTEVEELNDIINKGKHTSQAFRTAYILLNCVKGKFSGDTAIKNAEIYRVLKVGERTIDQVKKKFIEGGFESVPKTRLSSRNYTRKIDGESEAKLVKHCCSNRPKGLQNGTCACWPTRWSSWNTSTIYHTSRWVRC